MSDQVLENINIVSEQVLMSPRELHEKLPCSDAASDTVNFGRRTIEAILDRKDPRLLVVVGPCSIHDPVAALAYAERLKKLADELSDSLFIVMRVYFEKPRTTVGWKGFINDPHLDDSFDISTGLTEARKLLLGLNEMGLPTATEALDPISPQFLADLFSWSAIGARTTESQTHREMSSGLSTPVGFKNGTNGSLEVAINAMKSASFPHRFLGMNAEGQVAVVETRGNRYGHVILRGGKEPNYDSVSVAVATEALDKAGVSRNLIIDCSHANSHKKYDLQPLVAENVTHQIVDGNSNIVGIMLESHINAGNQPMAAKDDLEFGVSITDACIDWDTTEATLRKMAQALKPVVSK